MKAIALLLCLALPAFAQDAPRAEVVDGGVFLPDAKAVEVAQRLKGCETERDELRKVPSPVVVAVIAVAVGLGAGFAVGWAVKK